MKCGDVLLAEYPFTDITGSKVRPVLVVSSDEHNTGEDVIVVPISSVVKEGACIISDDSPNFAATGLRQTSAIKWNKPLTVARRVLRRRIGHLDSSLLKEVQARIQTLFSS